MDRDNWSSCLKVATMWHLADLRKRAITELDKLGLHPIDKIVLAKEHRVSRWLLEEYEGVLTEDLLDVEAVKGRLGREIEITTTCLLFAVQKRSWQHALRHTYHVSDVYEAQRQYDFRRDICEVFEDELSLDEEYVVEPVGPAPEQIRSR